MSERRLKVSNSTAWHNPRIRCLHCGAVLRVRVAEMHDGRLFAACAECLSGCDYCIAEFSKGEELHPRGPMKEEQGDA